MIYCAVTVHKLCVCLMCMCMCFYWNSPNYKKKQTMREVLFYVNQYEWKKIHRNRWKFLPDFLCHEQHIHYIHSFIHSFNIFLRSVFFMARPSECIPRRWVANSLFKSLKVNEEMKIYFPSEKCKSKSSFQCCAHWNPYKLYRLNVCICIGYFLKSYAHFVPIARHACSFFAPIFISHEFWPSLHRLACSHRHISATISYYSFFFNSFSFETKRQKEMERKEEKKNNLRYICSSQWSSAIELD